MTLAHLLDRSVEILRPQSVHDGQGGDFASTKSLGSVQGGIQPRSARDGRLGPTEDAKVTHVLYLASGVDILRDDIARVDDARDYTVIAVRTRRVPGVGDHHLEVDVFERQGGGP